MTSSQAERLKVSFRLIGVDSSELIFGQALLAQQGLQVTNLGFLAAVLDHLPDREVLHQFFKLKESLIIFDADENSLNFVVARDKEASGPRRVRSRYSANRRPMSVLEIIWLRLSLRVATVPPSLAVTFIIFIPAYLFTGFFVHHDWAAHSLRGTLSPVSTEGPSLLSSFFPCRVVYVIRSFNRILSRLIMRLIVRGVKRLFLRTS